MRVRTAQPCCIIYGYFFILLSMQNWLNNKVIQKLCWKTLQALSITGNAMPFRNQIILDIIHLILANFFFQNQRIFRIAYWSNKLQNLNEISFYPEEVVLHVCVLMRWQHVEPPKKSGRITVQQILPYILLFQLLSCIQITFSWCIFPTRDTGHGCRRNYVPLYLSAVISPCIL